MHLPKKSPAPSTEQPRKNHDGNRNPSLNNEQRVFTYDNTGRKCVQCNSRNDSVRTPCAVASASVECIPNGTVVGAHACGHDRTSPRFRHLILPTCGKLRVDFDYVSQMTLSSLTARGLHEDVLRRLC